MIKLCISPEESVLYFSVEGDFFPEEGWIDLISPDLECWIPALTSFLLGNADFCRLDFMDGPFSVRFSRLEDGMTACFLANGNPVRPECKVEQQELSRSTVKCIRAWNRYLHQQGKEPRHLRELELLNQLL